MQEFFYLLTSFVVLYLLIKELVYPKILDLYFNSESFISLKKKIQLHTTECNQLNAHIEELKLTYHQIQSVDYGQGNLYDKSTYNMQRKHWSSEIRNKWTHQCSSNVLKNASNQPFKYLCKYFNIDINAKTLENFENVFNNFSAVEQGKYLLINKRETLVSSISNSIPKFILKYHKDRVESELGFEKIKLYSLYFPKYIFQYISSGGNSSSEFGLELNLEELEKFINYIASLLKIQNSIAGQRALMTKKLREKIKFRDNFTCQICSLSAVKERNLLLEIDHIIPLSKGGTSSEQNLQTLCWKCNRSKGSKLIVT